MGGRDRAVLSRLLASGWQGKGNLVNSFPIGSVHLQELCAAKFLCTDRRHLLKNQVSAINRWAEALGVWRFWCHHLGTRMGYLAPCVIEFQKLPWMELSVLREVKLFQRKSSLRPSLYMEIVHHGLQEVQDLFTKCLLDSVNWQNIPFNIKIQTFSRMKAELCFLALFLSSNCHPLCHGEVCGRVMASLVN